MSQQNPGLFFAVFQLFFSIAANGQGYSRIGIKTDTAKHLGEITIKSYPSARPLFNTPASVNVLTATQLALQSNNSLVSAMNTLPGVRMEERSPGSYRLSIRGSVLRSPFGVRDVKIYFAEIPLTDAGGNTYLNAIDAASVKNIEVLKGPDGSLFGANSGGVVLISQADARADSSFASGGGINGGSYGLFHESATAHNQTQTNKFDVSQAYQTYNGYRQHSAMNRQYIQAVERLAYSKTSNLKLLGFFSDIYYQTPGGLTLAQMQASPSSARLASKSTASATDLNASVSNKMFFGGLVNETRFSPNFRNVFAAYGTHVNFTNPSFTTYEHRDESTLGFRTYFELNSYRSENINWKLNAGAEWQQTNSFIGNYGNRLGVKDTTQSEDHINTNQNFVFTRFVLSLNHHLEIEGAISINNYQYRFKNQYPLAQTGFINRPFDVRLMPRIALNYQINTGFSWRVSVSEGYSAPTTAEVRPTDHIINPTLQAQYGWNYETGLRLRNRDESFYIDAAFFYYHVNNTIVMRSNPNETSYFVNAGSTNQPGFELYGTYWIVRQRESGLICGLQLTESISLYHFTFGNYHDATSDYSGNQLTGVPQQVLVSGVETFFPQGIILFIQHNFTSKIPLTDANSVDADSYHLLDAKASKHFRLSGKVLMELYIGAGNLLNQHYSLGNDLNAALARYYNPAPLLNYYGGIGLRF